MKFSEIKKLSEVDREKKLKELKMELVKSKTGTSKQSGSRTREIKKIIARMLTLSNSEKSKKLKKQTNGNMSKVRPA